jgi:hypothetical protein
MTTFNHVGLITVSFVARNGSTGSISVPGLQVGDRVIYLAETTSDPANYFLPESNWEGVITVADQIQQTAAGNWPNSNVIKALLVRGM